MSHNLMEPILRELRPMRIEPQKLECPWQGIIIISRTWWLSPRVIVELAVGHEMVWLALTNTLSLL